jgi:CrcB protein
MLRSLIAVALGGALGTGLRLAIDTALPHSGGGFPYGTLIINVVGALVLGALVGRWWGVSRPDWLKAGLGAGLLGSFTTFSAIAVATITLMEAGEFRTAGLNILISMVLGLAAATAGLRLGGMLVPKSTESEDWSQE